jgi:hypothetical protein
LEDLEDPIPAIPKEASPTCLVALMSDNDWPQRDGRRFGKEAAQAEQLRQVVEEWKNGDPPILVFAGRYSQAEHWARNVARLPRSSAFRFVQSAQDLRGRRGAKAVMVGTFWARPLAHDLLDFATLMEVTWLPDYDVRVDAAEFAETSVQRYIRENKLRPSDGTADDPIDYDDQSPE